MASRAPWRSPACSASHSRSDADHQERRLLGVRFRLLDRRVDCVDIVAVFHGEHVPPVGLETLGHVLGEAERGGAVEGDIVAVIEADQLAQTKVTGERRGLGGDALHHVAIRSEHIGEVVHDRLFRAIVARAQMRLGHRQADAGGQALAQRSGGDLDAGREPILRVPGRLAAPLPERLEILQRKIVPGEVEQRVEQHRAVPARENEAVTVRPLRVARVMLQMARPEGVRHGRRPHRETRVPGVGLLNSIYGDHAYGVDTKLVKRHGHLPQVRDVGSRSAAPFTVRRAPAGTFSGRRRTDRPSRRGVPRERAGGMMAGLQWSPGNGEHSHPDRVSPNLLAGARRRAFHGEGGTFQPVGRAALLSRRGGWR